jgi:hypothetical protein
MSALAVEVSSILLSLWAGPTMKQKENKRDKRDGSFSQEAFVTSLFRRLRSGASRNRPEERNFMLRR